MQTTVSAEFNTEALSENTLIVVLGMHRSGTSVITRAMETMGAEFGGKLNPPAAEINEKGFFEDLDILAINVEVMKAAKAEWHSLELVDLSRIEKSDLTALRTRAIEILREKCQSKIFALKDPRISRLLPFWQPVFDAIRIRVAYIVAIRNPISVSRSLEKRDKFPDEKNYLLWLAHTVPALQQTRGLLRALVEYDRLLEDPSRELERISTRLNLPLDLERVHEFKQEFLESRLRHARFEAQDLAVVSSAPRQVGELFNALEFASIKGNGQLTPTGETALSAAQSYLDDISPVLRHLARVEQQLSHLSDECNGRELHAEDLQHALEKAESRVRQTESVIANLNSEKSEARAALEVMASTIRSLEDTVAIRLTSLEASAATEQVALEALAATIRTLEHSASARDAALEEANRKLMQMFQSKSWRITAPLRALHRYISK
ncbi:hypothetical protein PQR75_03745 [Paraburkholderia fungorum]|uniref:sulfotransferase family protein n=1 Tax=Paraburkholderia fungorum TaxID=134537 RepID=UPI0038B76772